MARSRRVNIPAYDADLLLVSLRCLSLSSQTLTFARSCELSSSAASLFSLTYRGLPETMKQGHLRHPIPNATQPLTTSVGQQQCAANLATSSIRSSHQPCYCLDKYLRLIREFPLQILSQTSSNYQPDLRERNEVTGRRSVHRRI